MTEYLHTFLLNEVRLRSHTELEGWQEQFTRLFNFVLRRAMPMEQLQIATFREAMFQSQNAEEALLVAVNACAQTIRRNSVIQQPESNMFGTWLMRIEGQSHGSGRLARRSLSFLTLPGAYLFVTDLVGGRLVSSNLEGTHANFLCMAMADLSGANFKDAYLIEAYLANSRLSGTSFEGARLVDANMEWAELVGANLTGTDLTRANLSRANLTQANLERADLTGADLRGAVLTEANLEGTILKDVKVDERVAEQIREIQAKQSRS
jgi:uncharacterized protein YjbI with pentapeptide repeats